MSRDLSEVLNLPQNAKDIKTCVVNLVPLSLVSLETCVINCFNQQRSLIMSLNCLRREINLVNVISLISFFMVPPEYRVKPRVEKPRLLKPE